MAGHRLYPVVEIDRMLHITHWAAGLWMVEFRFTEGSTGNYRLLKMD